MYIKSVAIKNLKSISELFWDLGDKPRAGWHVIIGDNGSGKSSFLRGISLALLGSRDAQSLRLDWKAYIRDQHPFAACELILERDLEYDLFAGVKSSQQMYFAGLQIDRRADEAVATDYHDPTEPEAPYWHGLSDDASLRAEGWFSVGYGPFRRFTGGDREEERQLAAIAVAGRHMSVFSERVSLSEPIEWLTALHSEQLEKQVERGHINGDHDERGLLDDIKDFVNQKDFLPNNVRLEKITTKDVFFKDGQGSTVRIEDLSDGYRSVLCMTLELLRQLTSAYRNTKIFEGKQNIAVAVPGIVLIDEVDVHLHPSWQRSIGPWFRRHFPKMQFIVTSHSPLVCQAAEHGTVYSLPNPDAGVAGGFVEGVALDRPC